jgi:hypothetical protein
MSAFAVVYTKLFKDSNGKVVIWQTPNTPLVAWALFSVLTHVLPVGRWQFLAEYLSFGFIFTWAWLELTQGSSYFRRILGAVVLVVSIQSRFNSVSQ